MKFNEIQFDDFGGFNLDEPGSEPQDKPQDGLDQLANVLESFATMMSAEPHEKLAMLEEKHAEITRLTDQMWEDLMPLSIRLLKIAVSGPKDPLDMELVKVALQVAAKECLKRVGEKHIKELREEIDGTSNGPNHEG